MGVTTRPEWKHPYRQTTLWPLYEQIGTQREEWDFYEHVKILKETSCLVACVLDPDLLGSAIIWSQGSGSEMINFGSGSSTFWPETRGRKICNFGSGSLLAWIGKSFVALVRLFLREKGKLQTVGEKNGHNVVFSQAQSTQGSGHFQGFLSEHREVFIGTVAWNGLLACSNPCWIVIWDIKCFWS